MTDPKPSQPGGGGARYQAGEQDWARTSPGGVESKSQYEHLLFGYAVGSQTPKPEHVAFLRQLVSMLNLRLEKPKAVVLRVEGFSDTVGSERGNVTLRRMRAEGIAQQLLRMTTAGVMTPATVLPGLADTSQGKPAGRESRARSRAVRITLSPMRTVVVVGSPSQEQAFDDQFVAAARCQPDTDEVIWLVEKTGYELYSVFGKKKSEKTLRSLEAMAKAQPHRFGWITPEHSFKEYMENLDIPDGSVEKIVVYSHGVVGLVALRYGWSSRNKDDYGIGRHDLEGMKSRILAPWAEIEINSCNVGTSSNGVSLARQIADTLHRPVLAWDGRTSYAEVNAGRCEVRASRYGGLADSFKEAYSRFRATGDIGQEPRQLIFRP